LNYNILKEAYKLVDKDANMVKMCNWDYIDLICENNRSFHKFILPANPLVSKCCASVEIDGKRIMILVDKDFKLEFMEEK